MPRIGIALDLGTSGFRGQALDLDAEGAVLSTAITARHPLPGANVMDHLHAALEMGVDWARDTVIRAVNRVIEGLGIDRGSVARVAVCGNPIQLSIFQNMEIRDLAYAGKRKLEALGVLSPNRDAHMIKAGAIPGLDLPRAADVLIPPAVRHEIGADALAMMIQTGMLDRDETAIVTDYGTNAEMALMAEGMVYTGSTAAGPALEGQQIRDGLLALPGAICDVDVRGRNETGPSGETVRPECGGGAGKCRMSCRLLDEEMSVVSGDTVDPGTGECLERGRARAKGITGTGVISLLREGMRTGLIQLPVIHVPGGAIRLADGNRFLQEDLAEAGKAVGAIRAGHMTLAHEAGILLEDIETAYMSGASGTYVDALKAQAVGMVPPGVKRIYQVGNTSLAMARDLVRDETVLNRMQEIAGRLRRHHCMFAASRTFEKVYVLELSYWTEGMPMDMYRKFLKKYGLPPLRSVGGLPKVVKTVNKDIQDQGARGLTIIPDIGETRTAVFDACIGDEVCAAACPEKALRLEWTGGGFAARLDMSLCNGVGCRRCEAVCDEDAFDLVALLQS